MKRQAIKNILTSKKIMIIVAAIVLLIVVPLLIGLLHQHAIDTTVVSAENAFKSGDYDTAIKIYTDALKKNANNTQLLTGAIKTMASKGNTTGQEAQLFSEEKPYIDTALQTSSADPNVLGTVGYAYETAGKYQEALSYYNAVLQRTPDSSVALFHRGHVLEFLNNKDAAYADYEKAYALDKNNPQIAIAEGNILVSQGKLPEAFEIYKEAAEIPGISAADRAEALTAASIIRGLQENFKYIKEAVALSAEAVAADPNFSPALAAHGYNLYLTGPTTDQAFVYVRKAISLNPRIAKNYYMLGLFYRADKAYPTAIQYLREAIAHIPDDNTVLSTQDKNQARAVYSYDLAKTYSFAGNTTDALPLLKEAVALDPSLKSQIQKDVIMYHIFSELQTNQEFITLVKQ